MAKAPEDKAKTGKRTIMPVADPKTDNPTPEPKPPAGNADIRLDDAECQITSSVTVKGATKDIRKIAFNLRLPVVDGVDLSPGIASAAHEIAKAAEYVPDGKNSVAINPARDWRVMRYILNPAGKGEGVEFLGEIKGALKVHVDPKAVTTATLKIETRVDRATFDRLLELRNGPCQVTTEAVQVDIEDDAGQLDLAG